MHESKIKKSRLQVEKCIKIIEEGINPFDTTLDKNLLFNIFCGRAADDNFSDFLLTFEKKRGIITECIY